MIEMIRSAHSDLNWDLFAILQSVERESLIVLKKTLNTKKKLGLQPGEQPFSIIMLIGMRDNSIILLKFTIKSVSNAVVLEKCISMMMKLRESLLILETELKEFITIMIDTSFNWSFVSLCFQLYIIKSLNQLIYLFHSCLRLLT